MGCCLFLVPKAAVSNCVFFLKFFSLPKAFSLAGLRVETGRPTGENAQACQFCPFYRPFWRGWKKWGKKMSINVKQQRSEVHVFPPFQSVSTGDCMFFFAYFRQIVKCFCNFVEFKTENIHINRL